MTDKTIKEKFEELAQAMNDNSTAFFFTMDEGNSNWSCISNMDDDSILTSFESFCLERDIPMKNEVLFNEVEHTVKGFGFTDEDDVCKTLRSVRENMSNDVDGLIGLLGDASMLSKLKSSLKQVLNEKESEGNGCCKCSCS